VEGPVVALAVADEGPGIPPDQRERVFARFYRGLESGEPGAGLGLSIVARIAALHGARVELRDGPGGRGTLVQVAFPATAGPSPRTPLA
jgi:signal transduction histidine kinase